jgi:cell wall-associated NlpC family hydrolase
MSYNPEAAVNEARRYIGARWIHRGRSLYGIDCIGLLVAAVRGGGVDVTDRQDYSRAPWRNGLERELRERFGDPVSDMRIGDVALIQFDAKRAPSHVGIITNGLYGLGLIHSTTMQSVSEHDIDDDWNKKIVMVFRP